MARPTPALIQTFTELEQRRIRASRERDIAALEQLLHHDFVFIHSTGRIDTRQDYLDLLGSGDLVYPEMTSRDVDVRSADDCLASVLSRVELTADYLGKRLNVSTLVLTIWVKANGAWRALSIQSTPVPGSA